MESDSKIPSETNASPISHGEKEKVKPLREGNLWQNPWDTWEEKTLLDVIKMFTEGGMGGKMLLGTGLLSKKELDERIPVVEPSLETLNKPSNKGIQLTWIGHASALVQMEGVSFLTDPVWAERASPMSFYGPKRYRDPPLSLDNLPKIDFVVISHNHYDHLDESVVKYFGDKVKWILPVGHQDWFKSKGVTNVVELNWWESYKFNEAVEVVCTPCQHWSKRTLVDTRKALWSSWCIIGKEQRVFFSGDTGYCPVFPAIGNHYGPFDLSLIAIGAYCPRNFMKTQHVNPEEAVQMHLDLKSKKSVGIHWGTFVLTTEPQDEPPILLAKELKDRGLKEDEFVVTKIGEIFTVEK